VHLITLIVVEHEPTVSKHYVNDLHELEHLPFLLEHDLDLGDDEHDLDLGDDEHLGLGEQEYAGGNDTRLLANLA